MDFMEGTLLVVECIINYSKYATGIVVTRQSDTTIVFSCTTALQNHVTLIVNSAILFHYQYYLYASDNIFHKYQFTQIQLSGESFKVCLVNASSVQSLARATVKPICLIHLKSVTSHDVARRCMT